MAIPRLILAIALLVAGVSAQRIAIIQPDREGQIAEFAETFRKSLSSDFKVLDDSLTESAYRSVEIADPFNLSTAEARSIGEVTGSDHFILVRSAVQRRAALDRPPYFEAYAVVYLVDSRTGQLRYWKLERAEGPTPEKAKDKLLDRTSQLSKSLAKELKAKRFSMIRDPRFAEVPAEDSPDAKGLRTPVPYRRLRPEYTELASLYGVKATIDIEVDIDADGSIARTSIERWAGYELEESVEKAVRSMNWRPAERNGKTLAMRVLLRYNFTKIEKDEAY